MKPRKKLGKATSGVPCATQVKEFGLSVGDVIVGREIYNTRQWSEARLQLLWVGNSVAVWNVWRRDNNHPRWEARGESADWALSCREWELEERAEVS